MASKKKLKRKLAAARSSTAAAERSLANRNERLDDWEAFGRWLSEHAPATVFRYSDSTGEAMPPNRPTLDSALRNDYMPLLRDQLQASSTLFTVLQQNPQA